MSNKRKAAKRTRRTRQPREVELVCRTFRRVAGGVEIQGHILNEAQVAQYTEHAEQRLRYFTAHTSHNYGETLDLAHHDALVHVLMATAPALKAQERILRLCGGELLTATGSMRDLYYNLHSPANKAAGIMLRSLVEKMQRRLAQLHHLAESLILQESTKLQDWTAREVEYQRLGEDSSSREKAEAQS